MPRPKKADRDVKVTLSASVLPDIGDQVRSLAIARDRSGSWIIEKLILRGLAAYNRDGLLDEPQSLIPVEREEFEDFPALDGEPVEIAGCGVRKAVVGS